MEEIRIEIRELVQYLEEKSRPIIKTDFKETKLNIVDTNNAALKVKATCPRYKEEGPKAFLTFIKEFENVEETMQL